MLSKFQNHAKETHYTSKIASHNNLPSSHQLQMRGNRDIFCLFDDALFMPKITLHVEIFVASGGLIHPSSPTLLSRTQFFQFIFIFFLYLTMYEEMSFVIASPRRVLKHISRD